MASHGVPRAVGGEHKSDEAKAAEAKKIENYKTLEKDVFARVAAKDLTPETLDLTSKLLHLNPEYYTIWNHRRKILQRLFQADKEQEHDSSDAQSKVSPSSAEALLSADLRFLIPLLTQFPKCYWIWNHRLWLLSQTLEHLPARVALQTWREELGLVSKMLTRDARNFHAWGYRRFVVTSLESQTDTSMNESEFGYTQKKVEGNLSNFSAWHYRSKLIPRLLEEKNANGQERRAMLDSEFEYVNNALQVDPEDQSLWFYHQFLVSSMPESASEKIVTDLSTEERLTRLKSEMDMISEIEEDTKDCKWLYQSLLRYAGMMKEIHHPDAPDIINDMRQWLDRLKALDPIREGRWNDLQMTLGL